MPLLDKFKRQCDVLESTEILLHILHETLRSSDREKDLEEFINQSFNVEHLYYIFTQNQGNSLKGIVIWFVRREGIIEPDKRVFTYFLFSVK